MKMKITDAQYEALLKFYYGNDAWWSHGATHRALLKRGLIERCDRGAQSPLPGAKFTVRCARMTDAGRAALAEEMDRIGYAVPKDLVSERKD